MLGVAVRSRTQRRDDANLAVASTLHRKGGGAKPNAAVVVPFQPSRSSTQQKRGFCAVDALVMSPRRAGAATTGIEFHMSGVMATQRIASRRSGCNLENERWREGVVLMLGTAVGPPWKPEA